MEGVGGGVVRKQDYVIRYTSKRRHDKPVDLDQNSLLVESRIGHLRQKKS